MTCRPLKQLFLVGGLLIEDSRNDRGSQRNALRCVVLLCNEQPVLPCPVLTGKRPSGIRGSIDGNTMTSPNTTQHGRSFGRRVQTMMGRCMSRRRALQALVLAVGLVALHPAHAADRLTVIHLNDWDDMTAAPRIAAAVARERARAASLGSATLVTFGGDMISPSTLSAIDQGAHMIALADAIGFDIGVTGNHEFDYGTDVLEERLAESSMIWLAGNVSRQGRLVAGTQATAMLQRGNLTIGLLGLVTGDTAWISKPGDDVSFASVLASGTELAGSLKAEGADVVIALTHLAIAEDHALLAASDAIDMVLGGHDHLLVAHWDSNQAMLQSGSQGHHVAVADLVVGEDGLIRFEDIRLKATAEAGDDPEIAAMVADLEDDLDAGLSQVIGHTATALDTRRVHVRSRETTFGNLLTDAMRRATGSDVALHNGGGIRGDTKYPPGTAITRRMVLRELPFGNRAVVLELSGRALRHVLEHSVSAIDEDSGRFLQVSGLSFAYDPSQPAGSRVVTIDVGDMALDPQARYTVATNDFLAGGGDGYQAFETADIIIGAADGRVLANLLADDISATGTISADREGRIRRLDGSE